MGFDRETQTGLALHEVGNSGMVTIPHDWRDDLDLNPDEDSVDAEYDRDRGTVTFHFE